MKVGKFLADAAKSRCKLKGDTLVVGGSDDAMDAACAAMKCGSDKVTLVCREKADEMRADAGKIAAVRESGAKIVRGWDPVRISVHTDRRVSGVYFRHVERLYDEDGVYRPRFDDGNVMGQYCDNLILAFD